METILGIDLGTTNSVVTVLRDKQPHVLPMEDGQHILPSAVGLDASGQAIVGTPARNQAVLAPDCTILSVKRHMGQDERLQLGEKQLTPQEVSAVILRTLRQRAAQHLGAEVTKAVITVPAFFNDNQRQATRQAGELAGLEVVRIINEPTAAALTYHPNSETKQRLLVYDLGGGTFDVSIVDVEQGIIEVLSSHGDTQLGGDDFDQLLLEHVCQEFQDDYGVDLRSSPQARSRLRQGVEEAKQRLSTEAFTTIEEAFIIEHRGRPLSLEMTIARQDYEALIEPLVEKTIESVDTALENAKTYAKDIDQVILVGGSTRTPLVQRVLEEKLGQRPVSSIDPDLCVSMGAAIQGGLVGGLDLGPVLVDITPHTLGVRCLAVENGLATDRHFARLIQRNASLPAKHSEVFYTYYKGQEAALFDLYQGEHSDVTLNEPIGSFTLDGLDEEADEDNEILVRFGLDLDGTLTATAIERSTSLEKTLVIDNALTRFRAGSQREAKQRLAELLDFDQQESCDEAREWDDLPEPIRSRLQRGNELMATADQVLLRRETSDEDRQEIERLRLDLQSAMEARSEKAIDTLSESLEDLLFYLED